jgi:hypothetical protein
MFADSCSAREMLMGFIVNSASKRYRNQLGGWNVETPPFTRSALRAVQCKQIGD